MKPRVLAVEKTNPSRFGVLFLLLAVFFGGSLAHGQTATSEIVGTVKDATGAVLPGVALTITNKGSGQARHLTTDGKGNYVVPSLPVGEYSVKAELSNFKTQLREGIVLQVGQQAR